MARMADLGGPLFVDVDGLRIRYVRSPRGDGATPGVLLSPLPEGLYANDEVWADTTVPGGILWRSWIFGYSLNRSKAPVTPTSSRSRRPRKH